MELQTLRAFSFTECLLLYEYFTNETGGRAEGRITQIPKFIPHFCGENNIEERLMATGLQTLY